MEMTDEHASVMSCTGHLLVTGGPGAGKTTIAIVKAAQIAEIDLKAERRVLFLSFARSTIARVIDAIDSEHDLSSSQRRKLDISTYHAFFWRVLKAHGYLLGLPRILYILPPQEEAIELSSIRSEFGPDKTLSEDQKCAKRQAEDERRRQLAFESGKICFDLFAPFVADLLDRSARLRRLISTMYPVIVLDEFQDTGADQWGVVRGLGKECRLIALADPEQRIYDFIGADPERLDHFREEFQPTEVDFGETNHRSGGTEILKFGNDALRGEFTQKSYDGVALHTFESNTAQAFSALTTCVYEARRRLYESQGVSWSVAVLVPTRKMTRLVSDHLREPPGGMTPIAHHAVIELEAAILGSEVIAYLMCSEDVGGFGEFVSFLASYYRGKGGDKPTATALQESRRLENALEKWVSSVSQGKDPPARSVLQKVHAVYVAARELQFSGNPEEDWRSIRSILENGQCPRLREVGQNVRNVRLLEKGAQLRQNLSQDWRDYGYYKNAIEIVRQAFMDAHFAASGSSESGVIVMNMHKAKGKQFDEVIIFEGWPRRQRRKIVANPDRIVRGNLGDAIDVAVRQNFRVSVTRSRFRTTIMTPREDPCVLLVS